MKTVYIAHPIAGDVGANVKRVLAICEKIHRSNEAIPVVPYLVCVQYLDDSAVADRQLGIDASLECFHRGYIDEVWLFGDRISNGMKQEIALARKLAIPVFGKTAETEKDLELIS